MIRIDIVVLDGTSAAALGVTIDVLDAANRISGRQALDWRIVGASKRPRARGGIFADAVPFARTRGRHVVVVPGLGAATEAEIAHRLAAADAKVAAGWLARASSAGAIVGASCTGVFLLGAAGLLEGRQCTTTWWLTSALSSLFPGCKPSGDLMVTSDRRIWTAGASLAHIDLMLALVAHVADPALADQVARHLIVDQRPSQARFVIPAHLAAHDPLVREVEGFVKSRLRRQPSLEDVAKAVSTSPRTLARRMIAATGLPPMKFVQKVRLDAALHQLQTTRKPLDRIAEEVGFAEPSALYRLVLRHTGQPPGAQRLRGRMAVSRASRDIG